MTRKTKMNNLLEKSRLSRPMIKLALVLPSQTSFLSIVRSVIRRQRSLDSRLKTLAQPLKRPTRRDTNG